MALIDKETIRAESDEKDMEMYQEVMTAIIFAKNRLKELGCEGLSERMTTAFEWLKTKFKSICSQLKQEPNIRFPEEKNIIWKVFGAGNLESWEYDEAEALVKLAKEELIKDMQCQLDEALELITEYNLKPYRDGNAWCILLGKDIQSGICGFGDTLTKTYLDFLKYYKEYKNPIGELLNSLPGQPEPKSVNIPSAGGGMNTTPPSYKLDVKKDWHEENASHGAFALTQNEIDFYYKKDQPVIKKSNALFDECVENCDPATMKEVSDNVDKMLGRQPVEGLEEEIEDRWRDWISADEDIAEGILTKSEFAKYTRHFAEWGVEHLKK